MSDTEQAYAGPAVPVQVITAARNLKSQPFIPGNDPIAKGKAWDDCLEILNGNWDISRLPIINKKCDLTRFLTEAAHIEDTSPQISDMKVPEDAKKLGRQFEKWRSPKNKQSGWEKQPCGCCGQTDTHEKGKNCSVFGKKCMKCQKFNHFSSVCKSKGRQNSKKGDEQNRDHKPPENLKHKRHVKKRMFTAQQNSSAEPEDTWSKWIKPKRMVKTELFQWR